MRIAVIFLLLGVLFTTCENKSCEDVVCNGVYVTCVDGDCYCLPGYEGTFCDQESYLKYIGSYQVSENCTTSFGGFQSFPQYSASITPHFDISQIVINNFANRGLPVDATIVSANFLVITSQNAGSLQVQGGEGQYEPFANRIRFEYNYTAGSNLHACTAIFVKF